MTFTHHHLLNPLYVGPITYPTYGLCVDSSARYHIGPVQYRCVDLENGLFIFQKRLDNATNNIGEFIALVKAVQYLDSLCRYSTPVYTDSVTAISWYNNKFANTTRRDILDEKTLRTLADIEEWLRRREIYHPIYLWDTRMFGDIPADFHRKGSKQ